MSDAPTKYHVAAVKAMAATAAAAKYPASPLRGRAASPAAACGADTKGSSVLGTGTAATGFSP